MKDAPAATLEVDVAVVGAGAVGACIAALLTADGGLPPSSVVLLEREAPEAWDAARAPDPRVWSLSRALTYRSLEQLELRGYVRAVGEEPGIAGSNRTILAVTPTGRAQLRKWLATPVAHPRDLRSELLLKLVIADLCGIDVAAMLQLQRQRIVEMCAALEAQVALDPDDVVALWRSESTDAALRFLDRLTGAGHRGSSRVRSPRRRTADRPG